MIYRLLYVSTAANTLSAPELEAILETAKTRNAALGLTGLLVFTGRHFMQLLEGERDAVEAVFAAICADDRHSSVAKLIAEPAPDRACPEWAMALQTPEGAEVTPEQAFVANDATIRESLPDTMPGDLRLLFQSFNSVMVPRAASA
ncbi:MAG: BLUF domain-containing protein [Alphaproteobacteria bacterium]|nr:BLUF domain-containing protein [Alphaproteobacteria bacterium]